MSRRWIAPQIALKALSVNPARRYSKDQATGRRGAVLITGASGGIGRACAITLDRMGFSVFAGVRQESHGRLLKQQASERLNTLLLDINSDDQITAAVAAVTATLPEAGFTGLINNAGIAVTGPIECVSRAAFLRQLEVNVVSQVAIIQAFLPLLRRFKGRIVNISSTSGRIAGAFIGPYCASKFALEAVTFSLAMELRNSGISVSIIEPGVVATPFWEKIIAAEDELIGRLSPEMHQFYGEAWSRRRHKLLQLIGAGTPPEKISEAVTHALIARRPRARYVIGLEAKVKMIIARFLPEYFWRWR